MAKIHLIAIVTSFLFLIIVFYNIIKGKLREEYAILWGIFTSLLLFFSIWRDSFEYLAKQFGVAETPNFIFAAILFSMLIYLLYLSISVSKLKENQKTLTQKIALLEEQIQAKK